jgi:TolA-binding protein
MKTRQLIPGCLLLSSKQFADGHQSLLTALGHGDVNRAEVLNTLFGGGMQAFNARDYNSAISLMREYVKQYPRNL